MDRVIKFLRAHQLYAWVFVVAVVARFVMFLIMFQVYDWNFIHTIRGQDGYYQMSHNLILGNGYSDDPGPVYRPNPLRPPVWIYTMAAIAWFFNGSYVPVFLFELLLGSLIPLMGMYLARRVLSGGRIPFYVGLFLAVEPYAVVFTVLTTTETSFTFLLLAFCVAVFKYIDAPSLRLAAYAGILLGLAILIKPTVQFLPILLPLGIAVLWRKSLVRAYAAHALVFIFVCVAVLVPWVYRNYRVFGVPALSSQAGFNLYTVLVPTVLAIDKGTNFEAERGAAVFPPGMDGSDITPANNSEYTQKSIAIFKEHKGAFIKSIFISMVTFFTHDGMLTVLGYMGVVFENILTKPALVLLVNEPRELISIIIRYIQTPGVLVLLGRILWVIIALFFFIGSVLRLRSRSVSVTPHVWLGIGMVMYFALVTTANGFGMNARFRLPVNALIVPLSFYGLSVLFKSIMGKLQPLYAKTFNRHTDL